MINKESSPIYNKAGTAGAAMKGASILHAQYLNQNSFSVKVASVAYDQRFCIRDVVGNINLSSLTELQYKEVPLYSDVDKITSGLVRLYEAHECMISSISTEWKLKWNHGVITHVMEVSNLAHEHHKCETGERASVDVVIAGQGFQLLQVTL